MLLKEMPGRTNRRALPLKASATEVRTGFSTSRSASRSSVLYKGRRSPTCGAAEDSTLRVYRARNCRQSRRYAGPEKQSRAHDFDASRCRGSLKRTVPASLDRLPEDVAKLGEVAHRRLASRRRRVPMIARVPWRGT